MSDQTYDGYDSWDEDYSQPGVISAATSWIGAIMSISLIVAMGYYGYKLMLRDVTEVPVVRALEGLNRIQPEDPGGETAAHQGLAVNEVQASGSVERPADQVILAPDPVNLTSEDMNVEPSGQKSASDGQVVIDTETMADVSASEPDGDMPDENTVNSIVEEAIAAAGLSDAAKALAQMPGVKRSPRPRARAQVAFALPDSSDTANDAGATALISGDVDIAPSQVPEGARLVQLGAFDDHASAVNEWKHIVERHGDLVGSRKRLIQEAESGGRRFFRLRMVGFEDLADSRRLCSALLARGTPCIPVTAR